MTGPEMQVIMPNGAGYMGLKHGEKIWARDRNGSGLHTEGN